MADTERLLDLIQDDAELLVRSGVGGQASATILRCITELRSRGDTLVRAADLLIALEVRPGEIGTTSTADTLHRAEAMRRLEKSLHGDTFPTGRENT